MINLKLLYIPFGDIANARNVAKTLISERLAVCANILPQGESYVFWKGTVDCSAEHIMMLKVPESNLDSVRQKVKDLHDYDCPCILTMDIHHVNKEFSDWAESLSKKE